MGPREDSMRSRALREIRAAIRQLNPERVRKTAMRPLRIGLAAVDEQLLAAMEDFLAPPELSHRKRMQLFGMLYRIGDPDTPDSLDLVLCEEGLLDRPGAYPFYVDDPARTVRLVLDESSELSLALARNLPPFRKPVIDRVIRDVAQENALLALATAIPAVAPNLPTAGWALGEFASDTAVLTMNQVRMAFLIAAASDREVGYLEQKGQIASIVAGAFGWRSLARKLARKIPFGGGLIPKAAIAYAGACVVGRGLERYYRIGYGLTPGERAEAYRDALECGRKFARWALSREAQ